jgi:hypothetical protein
MQVLSSDTMKEMFLSWSWRTPPYYTVTSVNTHSIHNPEDFSVKFCVFYYIFLFYQHNHSLPIQICLYCKYQIMIMWFFYKKLLPIVEVHSRKHLKNITQFWMVRFWIYTVKSVLYFNTLHFINNKLKHSETSIHFNE